MSASNSGGSAAGKKEHKEMIRRGRLSICTTAEEDALRDSEYPESIHGIVEIHKICHIRIYSPLRDCQIPR